MCYIILFARNYNYYNSSHTLYVRILSSYLILCQMLKKAEILDICRNKLYNTYVALAVHIIFSPF